MVALRRTSAVLALSLCTLVPTVASASFPAGVWALVEKVTLEPDAKNPTMIRIDGVFIVANVQPDFPAYPGYSVPAYGYMYYHCGDKDLVTCQMEWAELATVPMSDDICRGWGDSSLPDNGVVRSGEPMELPDMYPISMGILTGFSPCEALKAWMVENPPAGETTSGTDGSSGGDSSGGFNTDSSSSGEQSGGTTDAPGTSGGPTTNSESTGGGPIPDPTTGGPDPGSTGESPGSGSSGGSTSNNADSGAAPGEDKGCACQASDDSRPLGALAVLLGLVALGRRRRA